MTRTSEFLAAFRKPDEPLHVRGFKPRNAPETSENKPLLLDTSLSDLTSNRELQHKLKTANKTLGIYFTPNVGGSTDASITCFRSWFVESDSLSIAEQHKRLDAAPIQPSIRVETKKSVHAYWLVKGNCSIEEWLDIQLRLIAYFNSDPQVRNPSRVMRLPGFDHLHLNGNGLERSESRFTRSSLSAASQLRLCARLSSRLYPNLKTCHRPLHRQAQALSRVGTA